MDYFYLTKDKVGSLAWLDAVKPASANLGTIVDLSSSTASGDYYVVKPMATSTSKYSVYTDEISGDMYGWITDDTISAENYSIENIALQLVCNTLELGEEAKIRLHCKVYHCATSGASYVEIGYTYQDYLFTHDEVNIKPNLIFKNPLVLGGSEYFFVSFNIESLHDYTALTNSFQVILAVNSGNELFAYGEAEITDANASPVFTVSGEIDDEVLNYTNVETIFEPIVSLVAKTCVATSVLDLLDLTALIEDYTTILTDVGDMVDLTPTFADDLSDMTEPTAILDLTASFSGEVLDYATKLVLIDLTPSVIQKVGVSSLLEVTFEPIPTFAGSTDSKVRDGTWADEKSIDTTPMENELI